MHHVAQNTLNPGIKSYQQKLRKMYPSLEPSIKKELEKLLKSNIIFPVRHTQWISNLVPVRKMNGEIRLCVYFHNLNRAFEKDNYLVPSMEQILQKVSLLEMFSLLDGFYSYNKVLVTSFDQINTSFRTPWGTFSYIRMPFRLINAAATFQRDIDIAFIGLMQNFVAVYLDANNLFKETT